MRRIAQFCASVCALVCVLFCTLVLALLAAPQPAIARDLRAQGCEANRNALGPSRILSFDPRSASTLGHLQYPATLPLNAREIVLTFDDGPNPATTPAILDTLDRHCVKAIFFVVGWAAEKYPDLVRDIARRGHTIASHSWSHRNLRRLSLNAAKVDIERGFATLNNILNETPQTASFPAAPTGRAQVAPFFRFPGLNASSGLIAYLQDQGRTAFSCDIGTDDWRNISAAEVHRRALRNIISANRGIVIMHDTRFQTVQMLPQLLDSLKEKDYRIVQVVPEVLPLKKSFRQ